MNLPSRLALLGMCLILALPLVPFARHLDLTVSLSNQNLRPSKADNLSHRMSVTQMTQQAAMIRTQQTLDPFLPERRLLLPRFTHPKSTREP